MLVGPIAHARLSAPVDRSKLQDTMARRVRARAGGATGAIDRGHLRLGKSQRLGGVLWRRDNGGAGDDGWRSGLRLVDCVDRFRWRSGSELCKWIRGRLLGGEVQELMRLGRRDRDRLNHGLVDHDLTLAERSGIRGFDGRLVYLFGRHF